MDCTPCKETTDDRCGDHQDTNSMHSALRFFLRLRLPQTRTGPNRNCRSLEKLFERWKSKDDNLSNSLFCAPCIGRDIGGNRRQVREHIQTALSCQLAPDAGQASFATLKDWRSEAAFVLAEAHKSGWDGMAARNTKARRKLKSAITRQKNQFDKMGTVARLGARLSGKRRRIIREIMAKEAKLQSIDQLERRQRVLRRHFPL